MDFFSILFWGLAVIVGLLIVGQFREGSIVPNHGPNVAAYKRHMHGYVAIYSLMMRECLVRHFALDRAVMGDLSCTWH